MSRYKLTVKAGFYEADNLVILLYEIFKHRLFHLVKDRKWTD